MSPRDVFQARNNGAIGLVVCDLGEVEETLFRSRERGVAANGDLGRGERVV
jgi:hypothetical protein